MVHTKIFKAIICILPTRTSDLFEPNNVVSALIEALKMLLSLF